MAAKKKAGPRPTKSANAAKPAGKKAGYDFANDPQIISCNMNLQTYEYFRRLLEVGALQGRIGEMRPIPELEPLIAAIHHVIAGGQVKVDLVRAGNSALVGELAQRVESAMNESNAANKRANYYVTMAV
jgi:hypothetical protein